MQEKTRQVLSNGQLRAASKLVELVEGQSAPVARDCAIHLLRLAGFNPPEGHSAVNVNINQPVGWVIDWNTDRVGLTDAEILERAGTGNAGIVRHAPRCDTQSPAQEPLTIEHQGEGESDDRDR